VIINIGSNTDPVLPKQSDGPCARSIAFEPIVPYGIPKHEQLHVVPAAVADFDGLSSMHVYNNRGASSSLSEAAGPQFWNTKAARGDGRIQLVPTISLTTLLNSMLDVDIKYLKTDMQGHDFRAISSAGTLLRKIPYIETETFPNDAIQYKDVFNDLCRDWLPYMTRLGYVLQAARNDKQQLIPEFQSTRVAEETCRQQLQRNPKRPVFNGTIDLKAYNALWRLSTVVHLNNDTTDSWDFPNLHPRRPHPGIPKFTAQDYAACT
jgi:FkbM family methyltransferase